MRGYYSDFLRSPYWRAVRRRMLATIGHCERCGSSSDLQIHHQYYEDLGTKAEYYDASNLEVLCDGCHADHHGKSAKAPSPTGPELLCDIMARMGPRRAA